MNKSELIKCIAEDIGITQTDVKAVLDSFVKNVQVQVEQGEEVKLLGFGTFKSKHRAARETRNPQTGKSVHVEAHNVAIFTPGSSFKKRVKLNNKAVPAA